MINLDDEKPDYMVRDIARLRALDGRFAMYSDDDIARCYSDWSETVGDSNWLGVNEFGTFVRWAFWSPMEQNKGGA